MLRRLPSALFAILLATVACGASTERDPSLDENITQARGLDVNDVSWLFPLTDASGKVASTEVLKGHLLSATSKHPDGSELLPASVHEQFVQLMTGNGSSDGFKKALVFRNGAPPAEMDLSRTFAARPDIAFERSQWSVVAARMDPCFPGVAASCTPQVRLVMQRILQNGSTATTDDRAIHLIYAFDRPAFDALLSDFSHVRVPALRTALGVHPIMKKQGVEGSAVTAYGEFLLQHLHPSKLKAFSLFAKMFDNRSILPAWGFLGGVFVDGQARLVAQIFPPAPAQSTSDGSAQIAAGQHFTLDLSAVTPAFGGLRRSLVPRRSATLTGGRWLDPFGHETSAPDLGIVSQINNPHISMLLLREQERDDGASKVAHIDCVSCHATTFVKSRALSAPADWAEIQRSPDRFVAPKGLTAAIDNEAFQGGVRDANGENFRAFGYFGTTPSVNERTLNESLIAADEINTSMNLPAPRGTKRCDSDAIRVCQFEGASVATCLTRFCQ
jgi:hypothetical protein